MTEEQRKRLRNIKNFPQLIAFLRDELDWPIERGEDEDDLTFDWSDDLGLEASAKVGIKEIKQLRPLESGQPWGIFFVNFEKKRLPIVILRRILNALVVKKRASANKAQRAAWQQHDLLFISAYGEDDERQLTFAHFSEPTGELIDTKPTLRVLGWDDEDTNLKLDYVADKLKEKLTWPDNTADLKAWRARWSDAFEFRPRQVINTSEELALRLAELAKRIRGRALRVLEHESEKGVLRKLMKGFKTALIHDLGEDQFADMYAQTITYGLFSAAVSRTVPGAGTAVVQENVADMVPVTNPFLKEMLESFLRAGGRKGKLDFDELGIQEIVDLLNDKDTRLDAVLRDFGNKTRQEDPVIHFYEHFLTAYDKKLKVERGVFYTPQPVVSYIVRGVHELLQTEFALEDGLASTITWGEMAKSNTGMKVPDGVSTDQPFVQILDPATGTATFLVEVIDAVHRHLTAKWERDGLGSMPRLPPSNWKQKPDSFQTWWNQYVALSLLPRLHGYELMMAPYAIAHMKIGLKLHETGYRFGTEERARIYLTNSLEPATDAKKQQEFEELAPALAHEAKAVNAIKRRQRFTVVIGNPPYSGISSNMTEVAQQLVDRYRYVNGEPLGERKLWLQNDYVKFLGFAHRLILETGLGCLGYITDSSYLDGPTFRGVRSNFLQDFSSLYVLNLHGSAKKINVASAAEADQNVFDITQGVAILHGVRCHGQNQKQICAGNLLGTREFKYERLSKLSALNVAWSKLTPAPPFFQFVQMNRDGEVEYNSFSSIKAVFPLQSVGIQTSRDDLAIDFTRQELVRKIRDFASPTASDAQVRERYFPGKKVADYLAGDTRGWSLSAARKELSKVKNLEEEIVGIHYRPFDFRYVFNSTLLVDWPRPEVSEQMYSGNNLGLCLLRRTENTRDYDYFSVSRDTISNHQVSLKDGTYLLPLYLESVGGRQGLLTDEQGRRPNLSASFLKALAAALHLTQKGAHGLPAGLTPEDILHYAFAVFHSPSYRSRYAAFLKIDFPRLPLTGDLALFRAVARLGDELVALHLLESPKLEEPITRFVGNTQTEIEKISYSDKTVWLDKGRTGGFSGVPEVAWDFHIGGYQVCEKWLKDRKGRTLSKNDIAHYQKIVVALAETIRLMKEIDKVIDRHGGWPEAFSAAPANDALMLKAAEESPNYDP